MQKCSAVSMYYMKALLSNNLNCFCLRWPIELQNCPLSMLAYCVKFLFLTWSHNQQNHVLNFTDKVFKSYCAENALTGASERNVSEKVLQKFIECTCFLQHNLFSTYIPTLNKYINKVPRQKVVNSKISFHQLL